jgi:hypothetical protein
MAAGVKPGLYGHKLFLNTYPPAASMWVVTPSYLLCNRIHPYSITLLTISLGYFRAKPSPIWIS